ncbi:hypothetical protein M8R20_16370 [Pseudomonas sp. R2.Fl]|nr:hypothetical protein [Pseudomonas sp. R2.Fl]
MVFLLPFISMNGTLDERAGAGEVPKNKANFAVISAIMAGQGLEITHEKATRERVA